MTAKEYLTQVGDLDHRISILLRERQSLIAKVSGVQSPQLKDDRVSGGGSGDAMAGTINRYVDIERELTEMTERYVELRLQIVRQIEDLPDARHAQLLYLRYVEGRRLEDIACIMKRPGGLFYSYRHIKRMHGCALASFSRKYVDVL